MIKKKRKKSAKETERPSKRPQMEEEEKEEDRDGNESEDGGNGETDEEVLTDYDAVDEEENPPSTGRWVSFYLFLFLFTFILAGQWKGLAPANQGQGWKSRLGPAKAQHQNVHRVRAHSRLAKTTRSRPP